MALPDLLEIQPLTHPVKAAISLPGSKSVTNRALVLAALSRGWNTLRGALWSEDTQVMAECLRALGFQLEVHPDPDEPSNRTLRILGLGGEIPKGGTAEKPLELFVGNAGTAARFLAALVCLGRGVYHLRGVDRMHQRPQAALFEALRQLGYRIDSPNNHLPARIYGQGPRPAHCLVSIEESSQFASALLLCAEAGQWRITVSGENAEESPYVSMTSQLIKLFPERDGIFAVEPDASSGSYFWAADWLLQQGGPACGSQVEVRRWPASDWQIDADFPRYLPLPPVLSRRWHLGDSIMTAIVLAPFAGRPTHFTDLSRLRLQECERVQALETELKKLGAGVRDHGRRSARDKNDPLIETLEVAPSPLHGGEIETYQDHRMAMCFSILGLKVPGIRIHNPACVKKTFPTFFQKLAAPPPHGLGAVLQDARTGKMLAPENALAE
jgi:3-phosphoshikimate 1-carboxyvinyltransferase